MWRSYFLLLVLLLLLAKGRASEVKWYVSHHGTDETDCGLDMENPCRNLTNVILKARDRDMINIDGSQRTSEGYSLCFGEKHVNLSTFTAKSLNLAGYNGRAKVGCNSDVHNNTIISFTNTNDDSNRRVVLTNLIVEHGVILVSNCTMEIVNVTFINASVVTHRDTCTSITVYITHSTWYGRSRCTEMGSCLTTKSTQFYCIDTDVTVLKSTFYQTILEIESFRVTEVRIAEALFSNVEAEARFLGGIQLIFSVHHADILIRNSTFEHEIHPTRVKSVTNLFEAAIWLKAVPKNSKDSSSNATAVIQDCIFDDNERGITLIGPYHELRIERSIFTHNIAMHAGSGILVLTNINSNLIIDNCSFINNAAGRYRDDYEIDEDDGSFTVLGSEVRVNSECCKGVIMLVGKGGAIRVQRGTVSIVNSFFKNNTARMLGGSVFVDIDGQLTIRNSHFENTELHDHALQGDMLYSDGKVTINDVELLVQTARNSLSILRHSGDHWSMNITNVWMQCPVGYNLRVTNSSAYGVTDFGLRRSYLLDQLSYFCESCPRNKYSLDFGYLNYTMVFENFAYFTLLINGSEPHAQYTGKYVHHEIKCQDCPYGGHCVQGITSVANFWGYAQKQDNRSAMKFQHCPKGYCCSTPKCPSTNSCVELRHGRLCGRCMEGYSEALFSPDCVPNEQCGPIWLWPFAISVGVVYALFLLFQTDLKSFLFSEPISCISLPAALQKTYRQAFVSNNSINLNGQVTENAETRFIPNGTNLTEEHKDTPNGNITTSEKLEEIPAPADSGYLIILFYYFQDALLLQVDTVYVKAESQGQRLMKCILSGLFKFQLDLFELIEEVCAVPDMTPAPKVMTKALVVPYVIVIFGLMYIVHRFIRLIGGGGKRLRRPESVQMLIKRGKSKTFSTRLSSGFILALLFTFQKIGTTVFMLLNCVPVEGEKVLFLDGTVTCYQYWQYGVMAYAITNISPFFLVLLVGPVLMQRRDICLAEFFMACLCPLPALAWWALKYYLRRPSDKVRTPLSEDVTAVLQILQGPFKQSEMGMCWSGVLIGRRLVLILLYTFVNDALIRLLCMLLTAFVILLHHVHVQPYKDMKGNIAGTASAAALVTLGSINLVRAGFEAAEYTPTGPNAFLMKVFDEIENVLMLWFPTAIMSFVFLLLLVRTGVLFTSCCFCASPEESQHVTAPETEESAPL